MGTNAREVSRVDKSTSEIPGGLSRSNKTSNKTSLNSVWPQRATKLLMILIYRTKGPSPPAGFSVFSVFSVFSFFFIFLFFFGDPVFKHQILGVGINLRLMSSEPHDRMYLPSPPGFCSITTA